MEAEKLRAILASPPHKLEKTARRIEVPLPIAKQMRVQALNLMMGKCVLCAEPAFMGICRTCKAGDPENDPVNFKEGNVLGFTKDGKPVLRVTRERFLRQVDSNRVLLRSECEACHNLFSQSVDSVIKNLLNYGRPYIAKMCKKCSLKKKRMKALPSKPVNERPPERKKEHHSFRPFANNEVLEKLRPKLKKAKKPSKKGQKVKKQPQTCG